MRQPLDGRDEVRDALAVDQPAHVDDQRPPRGQPLGLRRARRGGKPFEREPAVDDSGLDARQLTHELRRRGRHRDPTVRGTQDRPTQNLVVKTRRDGRRPPVHLDEVRPVLDVHVGHPQPARVQQGDQAGGEEPRVADDDVGLGVPAVRRAAQKPRVQTFGTGKFGIASSAGKRMIRVPVASRSRGGEPGGSAVVSTVIAATESVANSACPSSST